MGILIDEKQKAVAYYRHSRDNAQENSIPIQKERVRRWAEANNVGIIHEEEDAGESGLTADRPRFQYLIQEWILNASKQFKYILFLDVSRMGRFQNPNEAGHLEYEWGLHGRRVWYIDRGPLPKVPDAMDYMMTMMQRLGAAEHSAKLSDRVWHGSVRVSHDGFSAGGSPCYGLERILLNKLRRFVCVLKPGERKQISNQRVSFRPARDARADQVRTIFQQFVDQDRHPKDIAAELNHRRIPSSAGRSWRSGAIIRILRNEAYIGSRVYNKNWRRLKNPRRRNPRSEWIICLRAFPALVSPTIFFQAQKRLAYIMPAERYKGRRLIRQIERQLIDEIVHLFHTAPATKGLADPPFTELPLLFSIRPSRAMDTTWHFTIPESLRTFDHIIGVGLAFDQSNAVECFFNIPTIDFGSHNVLTFPENSQAYQRYRVTKEQVKEHLHVLMSARM